MKRFLILFIVFIAISTYSAVAQSTDTARINALLNLAGSHNFSAMLPLLDTLTAESPEKKHDFLLFRALILKELNRPVDAALAIDEAMEKDKENTAAFYLSRASQKKETELYSAAIDDYNKAKKYNRNNDKELKTILMGRANSAYPLREYKIAKDDVQHILEMDSMNEDAILLMCNILNMQNNTSDIMVYLERGLKINPSSALLIGNLAYCYQNKGEYAKAIEANTEAMNIDSTSTYYVNNRGFEKYKLNDLRGALEDISKAIELDPGNSFAYKNRALVFIAMNESSKACDDLHTAITNGFTQRYGDEVEKLLKKNCR